MADQDVKWLWMMDYCKKKRFPPAQSWAWRCAEDAWDMVLKCPICGLPLSESHMGTWSCPVHGLDFEH